MKKTKTAHSSVPVESCVSDGLAAARRIDEFWNGTGEESIPKSSADWDQNRRDYRTRDKMRELFDGYDIEPGRRG